MRKHHPYAAIFPMMSDDEIQHLADDIKRNGQQADVIIDTDGSVLDGRNRLAACLIAGVTPREYVFEGTAEQKLHLVLSLNLQRRHLNESQRSMTAARLAVELQRLRDIAPAPAPAQDEDSDRTDDSAANLPRDKTAKRPRDLAAERLAVSPRSVQDAVTVLQSGDHQAIAAVDRGETAVSAQAKRVRAQTAVARGEHVAGADGGAIAAVAAPERRAGGLSREERAGIRRDVKEMIQQYPRENRSQVATLITELCRPYVRGE